MFNNRTLIVGAVVVLVAIIGLGIFRKGKTADSVTGTMVIKEDKKEVKSSGSTSAQKLYDQATKLRDDGDLMEAKVIYQKIFNEYVDFDYIDQVQRDLEEVNLQLIFTNAKSPATVVHEVVSGDTLGELAKLYGTTIELIKRKNRLKSDVIRIGQRLSIWTSPFDILVDKSQNILMLKDKNTKEVLKVYDVSTGEESSTPVGQFKVTTRLKDPVWFNRGVVVPPESPQNVLGTRWLGFDIPGYGIHGTIEPETIGQQVTAGCVRMRNSEVEELYSMIPLGTEVTVRD